MCDTCTKFEEDWTKIVVAIVDERFVRTDTHTHTQTYTQVILYLSNAMHCIGQTIIPYNTLLLTHKSITFNVWLQQMFLQLDKPCKTFWTVTTRVRLCTSVNTNMILQMVVLLKRLPAVRTEIWSCVAVYTGMYPQFAGQTETLVAQWTLVWFVSRVDSDVTV